MSEEKRCCAPLSPGVRCPNLTREDSLIHCKDHYPKGIRLYGIYKKLCSISETYNLNTVDTFPTTLEKIKYLNKCYYVYFKAYEGRMEHRIYGLVPECYDTGHDYQFNLIMTKIKQVERQLEELYEQYLQEKAELEVIKDERAAEGEVDVDEEVKSSGEDLEVQTVFDKVRDFQRKREQDEREEALALDQYIEENRKIKEKKLTLINEVIEQLRRNVKINPNYEYYQLVSIYRMIVYTGKIAISMQKGIKDEILSVAIRLVNPTLEKYSNIEEYLRDQPENNLLYLLQTVRTNTSLLTIFFTKSDVFWKSGNINISKTVIVLFWNTYSRTFLITYTTQDLFNKTLRLRKLADIGKLFGVREEYYAPD